MLMGMDVLSVVSHPDMKAVDQLLFRREVRAGCSRVQENLKCTVRIRPQAMEDQEERKFSR